jgi:predicted small secreted protein
MKTKKEQDSQIELKGKIDELISQIEKSKGRIYEVQYCSLLKKAYRLKTEFENFVDAETGEVITIERNK